MAVLRSGRRVPRRRHVNPLPPDGSKREVMYGKELRLLPASVTVAPSLLILYVMCRSSALHCLRLELTSTKRSMITLVAAAAVTLVSSLPGEAQIIYPFPPYRNAIHDSSVRFDVAPRQAEVYVDGYYAGIVDDFDGTFQRLRVEPGQHEITLYLDGYRTVHERVYLPRDRTFKLKRQMEPLPAGAVGEPRPVPGPVPAGAQPPRPLPRDGRGTPPNLPPPNAPPGGNVGSVGNSSTAGQGATGRLTIQVQPADASVLIDGQPWPASPGQNSLVLDVSEGRHVIQIRKPGYVGYLTEVDVRRGETTNVDVNLRPQP